jgi:1-acyl-sn-glycerol-3-phosphate acyltransferase
MPFAFRLFRLVFKLVSGLLLSMTGYRRANAENKRRVNAKWSRELLQIAGIEVRAVDFPNVASSHAVTLVANHVSWADIFALNSQRACHFIAKAELRSWPIAGKLLDNVGTIFINRSDRKETHRLGQVVRDYMASGETVAVFPEGTTSLGRDVLKFHASLLEPVVSAGGEVWVVAIRYFAASGRTDGASRTRTDAASYIDDMTFLDSLKKMHAAQPITVELKFVKSIACAGKTRREVAAEAEALIGEVVRSN